MDKEEIIEKYHHFKIKTADGIELDLIETKYYKELLDLYKQKKEKNKELEEKLKIATAMLTRGTYPEQNKGDNDFDKQFISKNKIKAEIEDIIDYFEWANATDEDMEFLEKKKKEILEEK